MNPLKKSLSEHSPEKVIGITTSTDGLVGKSPTLFVVLFFCLLLSCKNSGKKPDMEPPSYEYIENFNVKQTKEGKVIWKLRAKNARFLSKDVAELLYPEVTIYSNKNPSVIKSSSGIANLKTSDIGIFGDTTLESKDKTIFTNDVKYKNSENKIYTDKFVRILTEDKEITGTSMTSDAALESIVLTDQKVKWLK